MSWDVLLIRTKTNTETLEELDTTDNFILFSQTEIANEVKRIAKILNAEYDCKDLSWQTMENDSWSIEFGVGKEEETETVMLHIRGGEEPKIVLQELANGLNTRLWDCSSSEFISFDKESGFEEWKLYRDRVIGEKK